MSEKNVHVVPRKDGGWSVKREGSKRSSAVTETQAEAVKEGRKFAQESKGELAVHGEDGKIREKRSYGNDPCPPKDKK
jgi:hypothetical protein